MEVLFESRVDLSGASGKLRLMQGEAKPYPAPVVEPDTFVDGAGASCWGSILHDGGRYRMWYQAWPKDWDGHNGHLCGYAESDDGLAWKKPAQGLVDYGSDPNHLVDLGMHSPSVFIDPMAPSSHRYRAAGWIGPGTPGANLAAKAPGYFGAHSPDGLHWELDSEEPSVPSADTIKSIWHGGRGCGMVALKQSVRVRGIPRRSIWSSDIVDGQWSEPVMALIPDDFDDVAAHARGFASGDYYSMGMLPAGNGTVAFVEQFRHMLPRTAGSESGVFGATDISLAYQAGPGDRWLHSPGRPDFLTHGDPEWAAGGIYLSSGPVLAGDEHRLYFCGAPHTHGWYVDAKWQIIEERKQELIDNGIGRIGFASFPKFRLFGFQADPEGELTLELGAVSTPSELQLNYQTEVGGNLRVELPGIEGFGLDQAKALSGDSVGSAAEWESGTVIPATGGRSLAAKLHLDCATVWAYELRPA